jgi:TonB family protein
MTSVTLIVLVGLGTAALCGRCSAAVRHWVLAIAVTCASASPMLALVVPSWSDRLDDGIRVPLVPSVSAPDTNPDISVRISTAVPELPAARSGQNNATLASMAVQIWIAGSAAFLVLLLVGLGRLRWLGAHAQPVTRGTWRDIADDVSRQMGVTRPVRLLQGMHPSLFVTWGILRPRIIVPASATEWDEQRIRIVLTHEIAHIARGDWIFQLIGEALHAACWFNPLVWIVRSRLRHESEQACDDVVLSGGVAGPIYATHLLELARAARDARRRLEPAIPAPAMLRPGSLERRVAAMLREERNRTPAPLAARIATTAGLLGISVVIAGFAASAQAPRVSGTVLDPHGRGVPGAVLTLNDPRRDARQQVKTDGSGRFAFIDLSPGEYLVEAAVPGFRAARRNITVAKSDVMVDLPLAVGSLTESITITAPAGARSAPAPAGPRPRHAYRPIECVASATGGELRPPMKLKNVNPTYPANPDGNLHGVVVLEGRIGTDGTVAGTRVLRSPYPELSQAAVDAFEQWQFTPTLLNCVPIEVMVTATFDFSVER